MAAGNDDMELLLRRLHEMMEESGGALGIEAQLRQLRGVAESVRKQADLNVASINYPGYPFPTLRRVNVLADELLEEIWCWHERHRRSTSSSPAVARFFNILVFRRAYMQRLADCIHLYERALLIRRQEAGRDVVAVSFPERVTRSEELLEGIVGREDDVERIIMRITRDDHDVGVEDLHIIPLVGMPVIGKTTVAHMLYDHPLVKERFHPRIWVHVSPLFDRYRVLRRMAEALQELSGDQLHGALDGGDDDALTNFLEERLRGKRYLLVLDDVWNDDENEWDALKQKLKRIQSQSHLGGGSAVIIVTTRSHSAAEMMASTSTRPYELQGLSADASWQLFRRVMMELQGEVHLKLLEGGRDGELRIVKQLLHRCSGVPMLVCSLAMHIMRRGYGMNELDLNINLMDLCSPRTISTDCYYFYPDVGELFDSSIQLLPRHLRQCFMLFALFPEQHNHDTEALSEFWIAQRYGHSDEHVHFAKLWKDLFFRKLEHSSEGTVSYRMHHLMHQLALFLGQWEYEMISKDGRLSYPQSCRHASLLVDDETMAFPQVLSSTKRLKTLILLAETEMRVPDRRCPISAIPSDLVERLKNLCVLDLQRTMITKLPRKFKKLLNLRYLNLSETDIAILPSSIGKLQSLMFLKLVNCRYLRKVNGALTTTLVNLRKLDLAGCRCLAAVPESIDDMKLLKCLNVKDCSSLIRMPSGLGQLGHMHTLPRYIVGEDDGCSIVELRTLGRLKGELRLENLERVHSNVDAAIANLKDKTMLRSLTLQWNLKYAEEDKRTQVIQEVLEELRPNKDLTELEIICYTGKILPSWMRGEVPYLASLEKIKLFGLQWCPALPPLGLLPRLKVAEISGMDAITELDDAFYGAGGTFPSLQKLTFSQMLNLDKWSDVNRPNMFPRLADLTFMHCPKLVALEMQLPSVTDLTMWLDNGRLHSSRRGLRGLKGSLRRISLSLCENLLESSECDAFRELQGLEELEISWCQGLTNLPRGIRHLNSITKLTIIRCKNLVALPIWLEEFTSLGSLSVSGCDLLRFIPDGLRRRPGLGLSLEACPMQL